MGVTALDLWRTSKRDQSSFSALNRRFFGTHTREGKVRWLAFHAAAAATYARHILK